MQTIVNFISSIWSFITGFIDNLLLFIKYIGSVVNMSFNLVAELPDWLIVFATITITVSVLYLILGRSTGGKKNE